MKTNRIRVAYILSKAELTVGGSKSFYEMVCALREEGVNACAIAPNDGELCTELKKIGVDVHIIPFRPSTYPNGNNSFIDYCLFIPRLIAKICLNIYAIYKGLHILKEYKPQIIHTNVSIVTIGFSIARKLNIPHIYHIREYGDKDFHYIHYPNRKYFLDTLLAKDSYSICITKDIQKHHHLCTNPNSVVIYNGITKAVEAFPRKIEGDYFFYAGKIHASKGVDILLRAYAAYAKKSSAPLSLKLAGDMSDSFYMKELYSIIAEAGLEERISFLGVCNNIQPLMTNARCTIIPSLNEGFGRVMPEAMFCGCPVIVHDTAGSHEQLQNGKELTGKDIAYYYNTEEELAQLLEHVENATRNELTQITENAFTVVNKLYTTESNAKQVLDFYQRILSY